VIVPRWRKTPVSITLQTIPHEVVREKLFKILCRYLDDIERYHQDLIDTCDDPRAVDDDLMALSEERKLIEQRFLAKLGEHATDERESMHVRSGAQRCLERYREAFIRAYQSERNDRS